jgi:apolipoprotein D and lipocalin family protein
MNSSTRWITAGTGLSIGIASGIALRRARRRNVLETIPYVDLERYQGRWFEIARFPARFERHCAKNTIAEYTLHRGRLRIANACTSAKGEIIVTNGWAKPHDETNAKLHVRFGPLARGEYWILDLASDYSYAVVGHPSRRYLWILSRTPSLDEHEFARICERLWAFGYDAARLRRTLQE